MWTLPDEHPLSYSLVGLILELGIDPSVSGVDVDVVQSNSVVVSAQPVDGILRITLSRDQKQPAALLVTWTDGGFVVRVAGAALPAGDSAAG